MKTQKIINRLANAATLLAALVGFSSSGQSLLLTIDDSNPSAVVIKATGANSIINDNFNPNIYYVYQDDIILLNFTTGLFGADFGIHDGLYAAGVSSGLFNYAANESGYGLTHTLGMVSEGVPTYSFSTSSAAFSGSTTIDLSSLGTLPSLYASGNISTGDGTIIGQWEVAPAPEPSTLTLAGFGIASLLAFRRKK